MLTVLIIVGFNMTVLLLIIHLSYNLSNQAVEAPNMRDTYFYRLEAKCDEYGNNIGITDKLAMMMHLSRYV